MALTGAAKTSAGVALQVVATFLAALAYVLQKQAHTNSLAPGSPPATVSTLWRAGFLSMVRGGPTSPTTGVSVAAGTRAILAWNGSDFVNVGGGSAAGSNTQVQFNSSGAFGASSALTWDGTSLSATKFAGALNGTVGATTPATGAFTTVTTTSAIAYNYGGTGQTSAFTQYGITYASTTSALATTAAGTTGQVLTATTGGAPTWAAPAASGTSQAKATMISFIFGF
jgi:hypothetical protein